MMASTQEKMGWNDLDRLIDANKVNGLMLFSLEAWATNERHRFVPVISKVMKKVPEILVACAPSLGVMKGLKDLAKMEALFFSGEYFSNMSSVSVKGRYRQVKEDRRQTFSTIYRQGVCTTGCRPIQ